MSVYSAQIFFGQVTSGGTADITSPSTFTTVLRDIEATTTGTVQDGLFIDYKVSGSYFTIIAIPITTQNTTVQWEGRLVLPASSTFRIRSLVNPVNCYISGYELQ